MAKKRSVKCHAGVVSFTTKRGKRISFRGHVGAGCPKRRKPSTRHLARFKTDLKSAAKKCKGKSRKAFLACVSNNVSHSAEHPSVRGRRR